MLPSQRDVVILQLIGRNGVVTVSQICSHCNCSPETARRDLRRLEATGLLRRTHGGAVRAEDTPHTPSRLNGSSLIEARAALVDRADVLVVTPSETAATRSLVERARRKGVPIISESHGYPGATTLVAIDDYQAGLELGQWVVCHAQRHMHGEIVALDVTATLVNTSARSRGFSDGLRSLPSNTSTIYHLNGQGLRRTARQIAADALSVHPEVNVIFGINDDSALGALDAYRAAGLDETRLLVLSFGFEGATAKNLLERNGPFKASVAMFPELVGRICVDAAVCAYHGCPLPDRIFTPFVIVTPDTLDEYYERQEKGAGDWAIRGPRAAQLLANNASLSLLNRCRRQAKPAHIGYVQIFSSHEWYQNVERAMQAHARGLGITLEVVDASQDMAREIDILKQSIGYTAARFVSEGDTIIADAGATTTYLASALRGRHDIRVITNSLSVLAELEGQKHIALVSTGGMVRHESRSLVGPGAEATLKELRADKAFIGAGGLSLDFGLSNSNIAEAAVKQAMIKAAREVYLLADSTKIGVESLIKIAPVDQVHKLITDAGISAHDRRALTQGGVDVIIAET